MELAGLHALHRFHPRNRVYSGRSSGAATLRKGKVFMFSCALLVSEREKDAGETWTECSLHGDTLPNSVHRTCGCCSNRYAEGKVNRTRAGSPGMYFVITNRE